MRRPSVLGNDRGVAMVTVLFVGAVLTVVASTASFAAIQELGISNSDRLAGQALAHAEAGVDRIIVGIRRGGLGTTGASSDPGSLTWADVMRSGCAGTAPLTVRGAIGNGSFVATVRPQFPPLASCTDLSLVPLPNEPQLVDISSVGRAGNATRRVLQEARVVNTSLPIGLFAQNDVNVNGAGSGNPARVRNISLVSGGNINDRNFIAFDSFDPWYTQRDFYGPSYPNLRCPSGSTSCSVAAGHLPAAAHSGGIIKCSGQGNPPPCGSTTTEHDQSDDHPLSCNANPAGSTPNQSAWDGSSLGAAVPGGVTCPNSSIGAPPTTRYPALDASGNPVADPIVIPPLTEEEHQNLKAAALDSGLYCTVSRCRIRGGAEFNNTGAISGNEPGWASLPRNFTAYFDYPTTTYPPAQAQTVSWSTSVGPCNTTSAQNRSVVIVIRNGSFQSSGNIQIAGAVIAQEGNATFGGGTSVNGSVLARAITMSGNSNFTIDDCALKNLQNPFLDVTPTRWTELDRT